MNLLKHRDISQINRNSVNVKTACHTDSRHETDLGQVRDSPEISWFTRSGFLTRVGKLELIRVWAVVDSKIDLHHAA